MDKPGPRTHPNDLLLPVRSFILKFLAAPQMPPIAENTASIHKGHVGKACHFHIVTGGMDMSIGDS